MKCEDCGHRVLKEGMFTARTCSSCAMHPGWRREKTTRRILFDMRRRANGDVAVGDVVAVANDDGVWTRCERRVTG